MIFKKFIVSIKKSLGSLVRGKKRKSAKRISRRKKKSKARKNLRKVKTRIFKKSSGKKHNAKKKAVKLAKRGMAPGAKPKGKPDEPLIGEVTHFFSRIQVCVIKIAKGRVVIGDKLRIKGHTTNFVQQVQSLQIENSDVKAARKGQLVGLKIIKKVRAGDRVFKVV